MCTKISLINPNLKFFEHVKQLIFICIVETLNCRFKGAKCKDLLDNASYFAFIPDSDGTFTALPIDEWCDCKYVPKYKTLNIDEAEEEFSRYVGLGGL